MKADTDLPDFMIPGYRADIGSHTFTPEEIITFAKAYDPQIFHVDAEAARKSVLGGLCASGWHTASMWMRKLRDFASERSHNRASQDLPNAEYGPSPGFENLKWLRPVYAGDTVTYFTETLSCRASASKPGWYVATSLCGGRNQHGDDVIRFESSVFLKFPS